MPTTIRTLPPCARTRTSPGSSSSPDPRAGEVRCSAEERSAGVSSPVESAAVERRALEQGRRHLRGRSIAAVGGGTGLAVVLRGLKHLVRSDGLDRLTGVVTMSDDGGSSGRLRRELGVLPPGDIRNCMVALADDEDLLARLFQYRFSNGQGLSGHSFGNLFLTALTGITGDFYQAILTAESILSVRGRILPSTLGDVRLRGIGRSGKVYLGESAIGASGEELVRLELEPSSVHPFPPAVDALRDADLVLLGPGSLFTSILPNLLIPGMREALAGRRGQSVLLVNLMTQPGETDGMNAADHLRALHRHAGEDLVDCLLVNETPLGNERLRPYEAAGASPVEVERSVLAEMGVRVLSADLLAEGELIRHDPLKVAAAVAALAEGLESRR